MLGAVLQRADEPQRLRLADALGDVDAVQAHPPGRRRAGLVDDDRVHAARRLEDLRAADEHAELRAAAGADEQRGRRGEAERAGAGDDQHGDGGREGEAGVAGADPEAERRGGDRQHDRHEDRRDAVGEPLDGRLAGLRVGHEPADLRERGVGADAGGADDEQPAADVDRRAGDRLAGMHLDGHALAGQQRAVDRRDALVDDRRRWRPSRPGAR